MKKFTSIMFLCGIMLCAAMGTANAQTSVWDGAHTEWTSGSGTQADPYLIENASHLAYLAYVVNNGIGAGSGRIVGTGSYWKLTADIDLDGGSETFQWTPIGYWVSDYNYYAFGGTFDGNGHTIANLFINSTTLNRAGLFGYTDGASIKNVGINGYISVTRTTSPYGLYTVYAGGLVGYAINSVFDNCYNAGNISASSSYSYSSYSYSGGIAGYISGESVTVNNCYNTGTVSASASNSSARSYSGGIAGYISGNTVNNCYNTGTVSAAVLNPNSYSYSGGIAGYINGNTTVNNCYNTGTVSASASDSVSNPRSRSGGIVGYINSGDATVNNCYNTGTLSGNDKYGIANDGQINNSYYLVTCGASTGGVPKTEAIMKDAEFVQLLNNGEGFAYLQDVTPYINNGFPILIWQDNSISEIEVTYQQPANGTLTVTANNVSVVSGSMVNYNTDLVITATPDEGYKLESLTLNGVDFANGGTHTVVDDVAIEANFALEQFEVTYNVPEHGTLTVTAGSETVANGSMVNYNTDLVITATPDEGYKLQTLTVNGAAFNSGDTHTVTGNVNIECIFTQDVGIDDNTLYDITVYGNEGNVYIVNKNSVNLKSIQILDVLGRVVYSGKANGSVTIPVNGAGGIYIVKLISDDNKVLSAKVILND